MRFITKHILLVFLLIFVIPFYSKGQQARIDSLVNLLKTADREWTDYSIPLIKIGEPSVPALIKAVKDVSLSQWNRRISAMTLNDIHSPLWVESALEILFDRNEDPVLRNHVTAGLKGFDLSHVSKELWEVYKEISNGFRKLNIAGLLLTADTSLAYRAFKELYKDTDGYVMQRSLLNMVKIRPGESTCWFLKGLKEDDWMTANLAMDSLLTSDYFKSADLISAYNDPGADEEVRWRIIYIFGNRNEPESVSILIEALQDESWIVNTEAAVGLCHFDQGKIIPEMIKLKKDSRKYVRNNSRWVIKRMRE